MDYTIKNRPRITADRRTIDYKNQSMRVDLWFEGFEAEIRKIVQKLEELKEISNSLGLKTGQIDAVIIIYRDILGDKQ